MEFWRYLVEWSGSQARAVAIVGQCVLWVMAGAKRPQDLPAYGLMSRSRAYQLSKNAREFSEWLATYKNLSVGGELGAIQRIGHLGDQPEVART